MRKFKTLVMTILTATLLLSASSCGDDEPSVKDPENPETPSQPGNNNSGNEDMETNKLTVSINGKEYAATLDETQAAKEFASMLPLTLTMNELNGNEKYGSLSKSLTKSTFHPGTIHAGDILLWQGNTVVLFYETFSSSYSYTKLGKLDNPDGIAETVGNGNVTVTFNLKK